MEWIKQNKGFSALIFVSFVWVAGAIILLVPEYKKHDFYPSGMSLNELGDFLAGAFSPLAFLWLIYGLYMAYIWIFHAKQ